MKTITTNGKEIRGYREDFSHIKPPIGSKIISLTKGRYALVDEEDYEAVSKFLWSAHITGNTCYAITSKNKTTIRMHRFIMNIATGSGIEIDHRNQNGLDNRKSNLRICTHSENGMNKVAFMGKSSKYKGVQFLKPNGKWRSVITINRKRISIGIYETEIEAALAYNKKASEIFKEFAYLNEIPDSTQLTNYL